MNHTLLVNGCSMSAAWHIIEWGSFRESHKDGINFNLPYSWFFLLAKKLSYEWENLAYGGHGNDYIYETTLDYFMKIPKEDWPNHLVVIGWTTYDRFRIWDNYENRYVYNSGKQPQWSYQDDKIKKSEWEKQNKKLEKYYYKYGVRHHNKDYNIEKTISYIVGLQNFFENNGIPYYFFDGMGWILGNEKEINRKILKNNEGMTSIIDNNELVNKRNWYLDESFVDVADKLNSFGVDDGHPGKEAHYEFSNILYKNIMEIIE
jgi:hypothetical protein